MKYIYKIASVMLFLAVLGSSHLQAQDKEAAAIKTMAEAQNYIFKAQYAAPLAGRSRALTSDYDLAIKRDTIISYLPYFGRAYAAPTNLTGGGIEFTSTNFKYTPERKKNRWEIMIQPKDASDIQDMSLTIYDNGRASLHVNSVNRQSISFDGYITEGKKSGRKGF